MLAVKATPSDIIVISRALAARLIAWTYVPPVSVAVVIVTIDASWDRHGGRSSAKMLQIDVKENNKT